MQGLQSSVEMSSLYVLDADPHLHDWHGCCFCGHHDPRRPLPAHLLMAPVPLNGLAGMRQHVRQHVRAPGLLPWH